MIEDSIWKQHGPEAESYLKNCIEELAKSGILMAQVELESARLIDGEADQDEKELAKAILRHRAVTQGLRLIHYYGLQLTQERTQENPNA